MTGGSAAIRSAREFLAEYDELRRKGLLTSDHDSKTEHNYAYWCGVLAVSLEWILQDTGAQS